MKKGGKGEEGSTSIPHVTTEEEGEEARPFPPTLSLQLVRDERGRKGGRGE